jgi:uncharacterized protein YyaL (SSP411 family)
VEKIHSFENHLINETSPYLLQHAHNPVNWYPWSDASLSLAKKENKPIFLSIGYSACHWCHVMEKESFENMEIAEILNKDFVSIKVDREERPDLDEIYMAAVVAISGAGGWPMTVFLAPDLKPFYGGTYFPAEDKWGRIGLKNLLVRISEFWRDEQSRKRLLQDAELLSRTIEKQISVVLPIDKQKPLGSALLVEATRQLKESFDKEWGGFSRAPKFPPSNAISFLLRDYRHTASSYSLEMAVLTLDKMYEGGMYDHLGGGFHRYSVDPIWLLPHFEKMLYDNAQLAMVFTEAFQVTGNKKYARIAGEIFNYEMTYMTDPTGAIFSSEDADSEGKEGIFYLWKKEELDHILGKQDSEIFSRYFNVKRNGNFSSHEPYHQGLNILHIRKSLGTVARELKRDEDNLEPALTRMRKKLLEARDKRIRPGLDDKVITSWNALMISAYARGYHVYEDERLLNAAEKAASFLLERMQTEDGKLLRTFRKEQSKLPAYLEDYAYTSRALIDLYEAAFNEKRLFKAEELVEEMITQFWDEKNAGFFNTSSLHKNLIVRTKSTNDSALPSPVGVATETLFRLGVLFDKEEYLKKAQQTLKANLPYMEKAPRGYLTLLSSVNYLLYPPKEIAIAGKRDSRDTKRLLRPLHSCLVSDRILSFIDPESAKASQLSSRIPLLAGRKLVNGKAAAYVCENFACRRPATTAKELIRQLSSSAGQPRKPS